jgi:hypothetical protein
MKRYFVLIEILILCSLVIQGIYSNAQAIPAFARKYKTSCVTCHSAFPKLNAFGQAFRRLGYRFPEGQDAEMIKEQPVKMGADAYKQVWPGAVWPSDIPGTAPVAFILENEVTVDTKSNKTSVDFSHLMDEAELLAGGTIGDNINFLTSLEIGGDGIDIEMGYIGIYNLLNHNRFNLKIGQFPPEVLFVSNHRRFGPDYWITTRQLVNNEWSLEDSQKGFEANGILRHGRLNYQLGVVEGRGNVLNAYKDTYAHLAYKFGGLAYDGSGDIQGRQLWGDNSIQIGGFIYNGKAKLEADHEDSFLLYGTDLDINYQRLKINSGIGFRSDKKPFTDSLQINTGADSRVYFFEANYMVYPWLIPALRYEGWILDQNSGPELENQQRFIPSIQTLIRANVRSYISTEIEKNDTFELGEVELGLLLGF